MKNVYLFQPQYAVEFRKEKNYWLPYSVGCLWSYAQQFSDIADTYELKDLIYLRSPISEVLKSLDNPTVCGFSCYVWNEQYCLELAKQIKHHWPNCVIVFGGAQVSQRTLQYKFIDSIVLSEGEEAFVDILRTVAINQPVKQIYQRTRLLNLDIPSPYTTGVFDKIVSENPNAIWAMTLETNRGCPYACTFCDWGGTTYSKIKQFPLDKIQQELQWTKTHRVAYIFGADANFGIFKERDLEIARMMRLAADNSMIETINLQYAKNSTEIVFEMAKILGPYNRGVTVSVQSMNDPTLDAIKRKNMNINNIGHLLELSKQYNINTYTEVILGLPLETLESWINGLIQLLDLGQHQSIDIWFAQILENSEMASIEYRKKYGIETVVVEDYMNLEQSQDSIKETLEIVSATDTMSTDDIVNGYLYAWMIIHFHITGYSQIIAKYANNVHDIGYRKYYDKFLSLIKEDKLFKDHYLQMKTTINTYLTEGKLDNGQAGGHALHTASYKFIYENKEHAFDLAERTLLSLTNCPPELKILQSMFIIDTSESYPITLETQYNVETGDIKRTIYTVSPKSNEPITDFYTMRRKGILKNLIEISC